MNTHDPGHDRFDRAMRAVHADAVAQVSAATMAQLHRRRHAALAAKPARTLGWPLAAAFASVLAVAVGLGFGLHTGGDTAPPAAGDTLAAGEADAGVETALDALEQNPDFYVWLASGDADLLAME